MYKTSIKFVLLTSLICGAAYAGNAQSEEIESKFVESKFTAAMTAALNNADTARAIITAQKNRLNDPQVKSFLDSLKVEAYRNLNLADTILQSAATYPELYRRLRQSRLQDGMRVASAFPN